MIREKSLLVDRLTLVNEIVTAFAGCLRGEQGMEHDYEEENRYNIGMKRKKLANK